MFYKNHQTHQNYNSPLLIFISDNPFFKLKFYSKAKKVILSFLLIVVSLQITHAQKENNVWTFGYGVGIDFNQNPPAPFRDSMNSSEGCASICDSSGHLLFYSSGSKIWLPDHTLMPGSDGLLGNTPDGTCSQGVIILRSMKQHNQYYHFVLDAANVTNMGYTPYLRYSIIDMALNNGNGAVLPGSKNIVVDSFLTERMTVTKGFENDCPFYWLVSRRYDTALYTAYKIDENGIHEPLFSPGLVNYPYSSAGMTKISPDGKKIVTSIPNPATNYAYMEIGNFNNITGKVENLIGLDSNAYGFSFSPNSRMLYLAFQGIRRYDLSLLPDINNMKATSYEITPDFYFNDMRIGPDSNIYIKRNELNILSRINNPDATNTMVGFELNAIDYSTLNTYPHSFGIGSPGMALPYCIPAVSGIEEQKRTGSIQCYPNPVSTWIHVNVPGVKLSENIIFKLYNTQGMLVLTEKIEKEESDFNMAQFSPGFYFIVITRQESPVFRQIIIKS